MESTSKSLENSNNDKIIRNDKLTDDKKIAFVVLNGIVYKTTEQS